MNVIDTKKELCTCCMEEHDVKTVCIDETNIFKDVKVEYMAKYYYCENANEYFVDEKLSSENDTAMKNAFRKAAGLLTTEEIVNIRSLYGISQSDLSLLLGWGGKTITRYESHQVQDHAHDSILRKIKDDPEWFITLLESSKDNFENSVYEKYLMVASSIYSANKDEYLKKTIMSKYVKFQKEPIFNGNSVLSLDKVMDVIRYFSNSVKVKSLYKVKLMKLLWYSDALSYNRYGHSITGLVYQALPMGAVPIEYDSIINLSPINCEEVDFGEGTGVHFLPTENKEYLSLSENDISVLNDVCEKFGEMSKSEIVNVMHKESAFISTNLSDIIKYDNAENLSIL